MTWNQQNPDDVYHTNYQINIYIYILRFLLPFLAPSPPNLCQVAWRCAVLDLLTTFFSFTLRFWNQMVTCRSDRLVVAEILLLFSLVMNLLAAYSFSNSFSWILV